MWLGRYGEAALLCAVTRGFPMVGQSVTCRVSVMFLSAQFELYPDKKKKNDAAAPAPRSTLLGQTSTIKTTPRYPVWKETHNLDLEILKSPL